MEHIQNNNNVLLVWDNSFDPSKVNVDDVKQTKNATIRFENAERLTAGRLLNGRTIEMNANACLTNINFRCLITL